MADLISCRGLCHTYRTGQVLTHALRQVDLEIEEGESVAITGPSGCGKSTLLAILGLLDSPAAGHYCLLGRDVRGLSPGARAAVRNRLFGMVFQSFWLLSDRSVLDNVALPLRYRGRVSRRARRQRAMEALERVGMGHRARHRPSRLSGGEQQRVAIARALVGDPRLILADEPTGNLDSRNARAVFDLLEELNREGVTLVFVTHDETLARRAARRVRLLDGRVVEDSGRVPA